MVDSSEHRRAVLQALFVTFLWSTSWVLIKIGLQAVPALTFAGLRYSLAFLCLLPFTLRPAGREALKKLTRREWGSLVALGVLMYSLTQGAQFVGLACLPAVTVSLLLNLTAIFVALLGIFWLAERPAAGQWLGMAICAAGVLVFFYPVNLPSGQLFGLAVVIAGVLANAGAALLGRRVNRGGTIPVLTVTVVSMGIGAFLLLLAGLLTQGWPALSPADWLIIAWLALVNTAYAFTLWNRTLRTLQAVESSIINSTMLVQVAVLAWLFLGEEIGWQKGAGMALVGGGALVVQLRRRTGQVAYPRKDSRPEVVPAIKKVED